MDIKDFQHLPIVSGKKVPKVEYEYQSIILECEEYFGKHKVLWTLPYKVKCTESIIRDSLKICKQNKKDLKYFLGIIRNKTK